MQTRDDKAVAWAGAEHLHVRPGEAGGPQARGHRLGRLRGATGIGIGHRVDLDELFIDIVRELLMRLERALRRGESWRCRDCEHESGGKNASEHRAGTNAHVESPEACVTARRACAELSNG